MKELSEVRRVDTTMLSHVGEGFQRIYLKINENIKPQTQFQKSQNFWKILIGIYR